MSEARGFAFFLFYGVVVIFRPYHSTRGAGKLDLLNVPIPLIIFHVDMPCVDVQSRRAFTSVEGGEVESVCAQYTIHTYTRYCRYRKYVAIYNNLAWRKKSLTLKSVFGFIGLQQFQNVFTKEFKTWEMSATVGDRAATDIDSAV